MDLLPISFVGRQSNYKYNKPNQQQQHHPLSNTAANDVYTNIIVDRNLDDINNNANDTMTAGDNGLDDSNVDTTTATTTATTAITASSTSMSNCTITNKRYRFTGDIIPIQVMAPVPNDIILNAQTIDNEFYLSTNEFIAAASANESGDEPTELSSIQYAATSFDTTSTPPVLKSLNTELSSVLSPHNRNTIPSIPLPQITTTVAPNILSSANRSTSSIYDSTNTSGSTIHVIPSDHDDDELWHTLVQSNNKSTRKKRNNKYKNKQQQLPTENNSNKCHSQDIGINYWYQRYRYFSRYDQGVKIDSVGWYSVTPELIAQHHAVKCNKYDTVIDACAGVGGNTIQFALHCKHVIAIDIDPIRLSLCKHNSMIYNVHEKITFILGDYMKLANTLHGDVVFLSPPWGGPQYTDKHIFDIELDISMNGIRLYQLSKSITNNIIYCLPKNCDTEQIKSLASLPSITDIDDTTVHHTIDPVPCIVERNCINNKVKLMTAYYGEFSDDSNNNTTSG